VSCMYSSRSAVRDPMGLKSRMLMQPTRFRLSTEVQFRIHSMEWAVCAMHSEFPQRGEGSDGAEVPDMHTVCKA